MRAPSLLLLALLLLAVAAGATAAPPEEAIVSLDRYTTEKGKLLATTFGSQLRQIYDHVHACRPWLDVRQGGLGFTRPAGVAGDDRFLNIWVWVEQRVTPEFAALATSAQRASAMFSRHGVDLLRQLAGDASVFANPALTGYSVILTWLKPGGPVGHEQIAETLGVFADKATVRSFLAKQISAREFVDKATVVAFDGTERLGRLPLEVWEDNFATTFKPKDDEPEKDKRLLGC